MYIPTIIKKSDAHVTFKVKHSNKLKLNKGNTHLKFIEHIFKN